MKTRKFEKPAITIGEQLRVLEDRGLTISDRNSALHYLEFIGYYRLSGYMIRFQTGGDGADRHDFQNKTGIEDVVSDYIFDRKLRLITMDAIERIEVAAKATIFNHLAVAYGPHWYTQSQVFRHKGAHQKFEKRVEEVMVRRKSQFVQHYVDSYTIPRTPPGWMLAEELSLGTISHLYSDLAKNDDKKPAARRFGAPKIDVMTSWLHALSYTRNLCAHHARIWNRGMTIQPKMARSWDSRIPAESKGRFYGTAFLLAHLLLNVSPESSWTHRLCALVDSGRNKALQPQMGFPSGWRSEPIWSQAFPLSKAGTNTSQPAAPADDELET